MLLDLALPELTAFYLRTLRRLPGNAVVILSAYDDAHTVKKAMSGAAGFVSKSYSSERLLTALREILAASVFHGRAAGDAGGTVAAPADGSMPSRRISA